jgi:predicted RNase H-like HicB family nuclease
MERRLTLACTGRLAPPVKRNPVGRLYTGPYDDRSEEIRMKYKVALRRSEEGYSVSVPGLPGCWSQGATEDEALENIEDAIREYVAVVSEQLKEGDVREVEVAV